MLAEEKGADRAERTAQAPEPPTDETPTDTPRERVRALVRSRPFERVVVGVIVVNAIVLGLETSQQLRDAVGGLLLTLDLAALAFFTVEIGLRIYAAGWRFFKGAWNLFDFTIVAVSFVPDSHGLQVLRSLRILRALRLVSVVPEMRRVVEALVAAIPGLGSVAVLMALVFYIFAVITTTLFGQAFPQWFGSIGGSLYSLFQIMTLESWSMGIVRPVMETYPWAWTIFVPFILVTTFAVLNFFVAIIVNAMQSSHTEEDREAAAVAHQDHEAVVRELRAIRDELAELRASRATGS